MKHTILTPESDWTKTITVRVGKTATAECTTAEGSTTADADANVKDFIVYETLIRNRSLFFEAAMNHDWKEAAERLIQLPEHRPDVFAIYLECINFQRISASDSRTLVDAYILGDVLQDADFRDAIIDVLADTFVRKSVFTTKMFEYVYDNTPDGSPIRRFFVDTLTYIHNADRWIANLRKRPLVPVDVLFDLLAGLAKLKATDQKIRWKDAPFHTNMCHYHEHKEETCYKVKYLSVLGFPNVSAKVSRL